MSTKLLVRGVLPRYITIPDGGLAFGSAVEDGIPFAVPFIDAEGLLAQDEDFVYHPGNVIDDESSEFTIKAKRASGGAGLRAVSVDGTEVAYVYALEDLALVGLQVGATIARLKLNDLGLFTIDVDDVAISALAGIGTRNVVVDANGKLSAP